MALNNETIQYMQRLEEQLKDNPGREYAHKYRNWKDWLVYEAYRPEILSLKRDFMDAKVDEKADRPHALSSAERARMVKELRAFMEFVYRTWTDQNANAWVGGTWHRVGEAYAARMLFYQHERGVMKQRLKPKPIRLEQDIKTFCEVFNIAL